MVRDDVTGRSAPEQVLLMVYGPQDAIPFADPGRWMVVSQPAHYEMTLSALHIFTDPSGRSVSQCKSLRRTLS